MSSETTLIPGWLCTLIAGHLHWMRSGSRVAFAIVTILTLIVLFALTTPLTGAVNKGAPLPILRVSLMMATSAFALIILGKTMLADFRQPK